MRSHVQGLGEDRAWQMALAASLPEKAVCQDADKIAKTPHKA